MSLLLLAIIFAQQTISTVVKQVDLTPINTNQNDATITEGAYTTNDVTVDIAEWDILVSANSQRGYHLEIDLNNTWGFHPNKESSISFTMFSSTNITQDELHLLISFSVNNNSYITYFLSLDTLHVNNVHPANCDISTSPTQSLATGSVKSCVDSDYCSTASSSDRDCKATGACQYNPILPNNLVAHIGSHFNSWPLTITLLNNPITNTLFATISSPSWNGWTQGCGFGESFATNSGLQIYIGVDEAGESISFHNFHIVYSYDTNGPTQHSTKNPTANPTAITTATPMAYTTINGIWINDFVAAPPSGWLLTVNGNATQYASITTSVKTYDGPFVGISSGSRDIYHLSQQFYCAQSSSVEIRYYMLYCGTDVFDYLKTADDLSSSTVYGTSGYKLNAYDEDLNATCNEGWYWRGEFNAIIPFVPVASLFKVGFEISVDSDNEAIVIDDLKVECKPTLQATPSPTTALITSTASPTTKVPITKLPTTAPSKQPTNMPSKQPTNIPSKQPTNIPLKQSTNIPTTQPTHIPLKQPTNNPATQPTNSPSTRSTSNQSAEPTTPNVPGLIVTVLASMTTKPEGEYLTTQQTEAENENPQKFDDKQSHWIYVVIVCIILFCVLIAALGVYKWKQRKSIKKLEVVEENMVEQIKKMSLEQIEMVNICKDKNKEGSGGGELFENVESGHITSGFSDVDDSDEHIDGEDEDENMYMTPKQNIGPTPTLFGDGFNDNDNNEKQDENEGISMDASPRNDVNTSSKGKTLNEERISVENWNIDDVVIWIESIQNGKYKKYSTLFREQNIKGIDLKVIEKTDLCDFGINIFADRNDIFNEIQNLHLVEEGDV